MKGRILQIGLDMGSAVLRIARGDTGQVWQAPALAAVPWQGGLPVAAGEAAAQLLTHAPGLYRGAAPVQEGCIGDTEQVIYLLRTLLAEVELKPGLLRRLHATICIPPDLPVEQYRLWEYCAAMAGCARVMFVHAPLAAALQHGWEVTRPYGRLTLDVGAGLPRASILSYSEVCSHGAGLLRGDSLQEGIFQYLQASGDIRTGGDVTALCRSLCAAGQDGLLPGAGTRYAHEFAGVLAPFYAEGLRAVKQACSSAHPELLADIAEEGILLFGGNAGLYGLAEFLQEETALPVQVASHPGNAAVLGACLAAQLGL